MKKSIYIFLILITTLGCYSQIENNSNIPPKWIFDLIQKSNMELVYGDNFPYINPFGSYGSPFISGVLKTGSNIYNKDKGLTMAESFNYVLFYVRKKKTDSIVKDDYLNYNYYLVFAKTKPLDFGGDFLVDSIFDAPGGLLGMHLQYGKLDINLSEFSYLNNPSRKGPKNIIASQVNTPIIFPSENGTITMVYYKSEWLIHFERDI